MPSQMCSDRIKNWVFKHADLMDVSWIISTIMFLPLVNALIMNQFEDVSIYKNSKCEYEQVIVGNGV